MISYVTYNIIGCKNQDVGCFVRCLAVDVQSYCCTSGLLLLVKRFRTAINPVLCASAVWWLLIGNHLPYFFSA